MINGELQWVKLVPRQKLFKLDGVEKGWIFDFYFVFGRTQ